ncbi:MAG: ATP-binding cassette domain-containing protein, partial [Lentisphaerae bacterium]|nr:ATP-binding cassette domain-containing protein [Lentisphaerota bacterium]
VLEGSITLDGHDIREMDLHSLRRHFGIVLQEPMLFNVSLADNIRYADLRAPIERVKQAAKIAEIEEYILSLPKGYDTIVGGRTGVTLSVGQKQRLSLARAVLGNPAILLMDEATSSLDSESERAIQVALDRFLKGRTSFIVAHRLSTIKNADKIVLIDKGRIAECGSHDELILAGGRYHDLYNKHMGKGILTVD